MMIISSIDLYTIHSMFRVSLKVCMQSFDNLTVKENRVIKINKAYGHNTYVNITPAPYLVIDTSRGVKDGIQRSINLNRRDAFILCQTLSKIVKDFKDISDLFIKYQMTNSLVFNSKYKDLEYSIITKGGTESLKFKPNVVNTIGPNGNVDGSYEGVDVFINNYPVSYLTYGDTLFLLSELTKLNMVEMAVQLITTTISALSVGNRSEIVSEEMIVNNKPLEIETKEPDLICIKQEVQKDEPAIPNI